MAVRQFKNIPSLLEVECSGGTLQPETSLLSLKTYSLPDHTATGYLNTLKEECLTLQEYSSCVLDPVDTRRSRVRFLVADLQEGEGRRYGCDAISFKSLGDTTTWTWTVDVRRNSELGVGVGVGDGGGGGVCVGGIFLW